MIKGPPCIGKKTLIRHFLRENSSQYTDFLVLAEDPRTNLLIQIVDFMGVNGEKLSQPLTTDSIIQHVNNSLKNNSVFCLILLDIIDFNKINPLLAGIMFTNQMNLLVTTPRKDNPLSLDNLNIESQFLIPWSTEETVKLIDAQRQAGILKRCKEDSEGTIKTLAQCMGGFPAAIHQVNDFCDEKKIDINEFLSRSEWFDGIDLLSDHEQNNNKKGITHKISSLVEYVCREPRASETILLFLAVLDVESIDTCSLKKLASQISDFNEEYHRRSQAKLEKFSLINIENKKVYINPLVSRVIFNEYYKNHRENLCPIIFSIIDFMLNNPMNNPNEIIRNYWLFKSFFTIIKLLLSISDQQAALSIKRTLLRKQDKNVTNLSSAIFDIFTEHAGLIKKLGGQSAVDRVEKIESIKNNLLRYIMIGTSFPQTGKHEKEVASLLNKEKLSDEINNIIKSSPGDLFKSVILTCRRVATPNKSPSIENIRNSFFSKSDAGIVRHTLNQEGFLCCQRTQSTKIENLHYYSNSPLIKNSDNTKFNKVTIISNPQPKKGVSTMDDQLPLKDINSVLALRQNILSQNPTNQLELASLKKLEMKILDTFLVEPNPSTEWMADMLWFCFMANDKELVLKAVNAYLKNIEDTSILLDFSTIQGFADILGLAHKFNVLDKSRVYQVFQSMIENSLLLKPDLSKEQLKKNAKLWERLLTSMHFFGVDLAGHKKDIEELIKGMKSVFKDDDASLWQCRRMEQALLRLGSGSNESSEVAKAAWYLGSASLGLLQTVGTGAIVGIATGGPGAVAGVAALLPVIKDLGKAGVHVAKAIKGKWDKKAWYYKIQQLAAILLTTASQENSKEFCDIISELVLDDKPHDAVLYALTETFVQIAFLKSSQPKSDVYSFIYSALWHWLNHTESNAVKAHLLNSIIRIGFISGIEDFLHLTVKLIQVDYDDYASLPLSASDIASFVQLYDFYTKQPHDEQNREQPKFIVAQSGMIDRLKQQYANNPRVIADCLVRLQEIDDFSKSNFIKPLLGDLAKRPGYEKHKQAAAIDWNIILDYQVFDAVG